MQVIITMAGLGKRFSDQGYEIPKPFIQIENIFAVEHLVDSFPKDWKFIFAIGEHLRNCFELKQFEERIITRKLSYQIIFVEYSKRGPIDTVGAVLSQIDLNKPTSVSYCDYSMMWDSFRFQSSVIGSDIDCAIMSYQGYFPTYLGPNSYCHLQVRDREVVDLKEKEFFTNDIYQEWTSCGFYYFKSGYFLKECLAEQEKQNLNYKGSEFYTSLAIKAMMNKNIQLKVIHYPLKYFIQFGTPEDIERYNYWLCYYKKTGVVKNINFQTTDWEANYWKGYFSEKR